MSSTQPLSVIPRSISQMLTGATQYPRERMNSTITLEDGRQYRVFREVIMRNNPPQETGGVFRVWFYAVTTPQQTITMSQMTKLFFVGMPGFRGKMWLLNDATQEFGGIYQFDTVEQARDYAQSFAMGLSKRRSRPGMFSVETYAKTGEASLFRAQEQSIVADSAANVVVNP
jgi:hypothetical protein